MSSSKISLKNAIDYKKRLKADTYKALKEADGGDQSLMAKDMDTAFGDAKMGVISEHILRKAK